MCFSCNQTFFRNLGTEGFQQYIMLKRFVNHYSENQVLSITIALEYFALYLILL